ncbi:geranylgeranyl pyrophosphate synthase [Pseudoclavibacter endophyticus]|nr:geranylgeranyl pyrophosphate synthase [Pseudoclavibacter endophyticus]
MGAADAPALPDAAAALELFHAAALAHDDVIDRSDTRRGAPSTHRAFEAHHGASGWAGDGARFGEAAAILVGDLLLTWSDDLFVAACAAVDPTAAEAARGEISRMRVEVTLGQYLDVAEEHAWPTVPVGERAERAITIAVSKSARYSIEAPLVIGARLAGADDERVDAIRAFGTPLGLAFQLRDDVLGVFGDAEIMGKPAGDDLREGKRTYLIARFSDRSSDAEREWFDARLGRDDLDEATVAELQRRIRGCGALDDVEAEIARLLGEALTALDSAGLDAASRGMLERLARRTAARDY